VVLSGGGHDDVKSGKALLTKIAGALDGICPGDPSRMSLVAGVGGVDVHGRGVQQLVVGSMHVSRGVEIGAGDFSLLILERYFHGRGSVLAGQIRG